VATDPAKYLSGHFNTNIPMAGLMGITVSSCTPDALILEAPLGPNRNDKGTAFAGSIYAAAVLAGWGMVTARLLEQGMRVPVVIERSGMQYLSPVRGPFTARCPAPPGKTWGTFMDRVRSGKNARIELAVDLLEGTSTRARFTGVLVALGGSGEPAA
jgi:thioesterase domain-containing protein